MSVLLIICRQPLSGCGLTFHLPCQVMSRFKAREVCGTVKQMSGNVERGPKVETKMVEACSWIFDTSS